MCSAHLAVPQHNSTSSALSNASPILLPVPTRMIRMAGLRAGDVVPSLNTVPIRHGSANIDTLGPRIRAVWGPLYG